MRAMRTWWVLGLVGVLGGCSSSGSSGLGGIDDGGAGQGGGSSATGGSGGSAGTGGGGIVVPDEPTDPLDPGSSDPSCGDVGDSIFVVSSETVLLRFKPATLAFETIGALKCPSSFGDTPYSMAVNRNGTAYVLYQSGNIFKVDTKTAACTSSGYKPDQKGWNLFGMGYVTNGTSGPDETLFVMDGGDQGLGQIDTKGVLSPIGQFDSGLEGRSAEVTGRGDGRLFAFFVDQSSDASSVAEIDKATGHVLSNVDQSLGAINAWAFAHWGGSFYLFHGDSGPSKVTKYTPGKGSTLVVKDAGYRIVGAGVSTCAPTKPPPVG